jgi:hypothetical protein
MRIAANRTDPWSNGSCQCAGSVKRRCRLLRSPFRSSRRSQLVDMGKLSQPRIMAISWPIVLA